MNPTWTAIIDGLVKILQVSVPILLAVIGYIQFMAGKKAEAAQIKAAQDREDAKLAIAEAAKKVEAVKDALVSQGSETKQQLNIIHSLGNAQLTGSINNELVAKRYSLVLMKEVADMRGEFNQKPTVETVSAIAALEAEIATLARTLEERRIQQEKIDEKIAESQKGPIQVEAKIINTIDQPVPVVPPT